MYFDTLTYVPIYLEGINPSLMEPGQIRMLNEYHKAVYEKISPLLTEEDRLWLKEETREIYTYSYIAKLELENLDF